MIKNYFSIAIRNLFKRKGYSFLNIFGLAIGITCCLLIFQYVAYERSYDDFPQNAKNIVRLRLDAYQQGKLSWKSATVYPAFGPTMKKDFPEVEEFCRLYDANLLLSNDERNVKANERQGYFADASFLDMFDIRLISGDRKTVLDGPDKLLLSETLAKKYFGTSDPVGKRLIDRNPSYTRSYEVTGVFKDFPVNSHLTVNHLASYATLAAINRFFGDTTNATETNWGWYDFYTYLQLKPGTDLEKFSAKFPAFCDKYINSIEWYKTNNVRNEIHALPLQDIHLYSNYNQEAEVNGNGQAVAFLFLIAFFIIGIAWINYINLATARSLERAKEVGVRKVMGAMRSNLIGQFLVESLLLNLLALLLAIILAYLLTPLFKELTGQTHTQRFYLPAGYWLGFGLLFLLGSFFAGLYPAFVLSGFKPVMVLKGLFKNSGSGILLRKGLIVTQFATSVVLIAGTIIVYQQVGYMRKQKLGVDINQTLILDGAGSVIDSMYRGRMEAFRNDLLEIPSVKNVASSSSIMGREIYWTNGAWRMGDGGKGAVTLYNMGIDYDFIPSFGMQLKAGRNFSRDFGDSSRTVILNETAAKLLGFTDFEKSINERFVTGGDTVKLIGIVADYHHQGLQKAIDPMLIRLVQNARSAYSLKVETKDMAATIAAVNKAWSQHFPSDPFNYFFLDEFFDQQYKADRLFGKVFGLFAFLAILVACFGLLGLSAYNVLQRTKEIGIRKVLGASVQHVLFILSKDFIYLVLVSFVIATPITWLIMHNWLEGFAYRINIGWWVFLVAGVLALLIALATITTQALKAALSNPVKSLRTE